jgi:hypothetical protein
LSFVGVVVGYEPNKKTRTQTTMTNTKICDNDALTNNQTLYTMASDWLRNSQGQGIVADTILVV